MTNTLIILLVLVWVLQIGLGYWQIRCFNQTYTTLAKKGAYIGVGKSSGRFKPKVVIIVALNEEKKVVDSILMQGLTVFSKPEALTQIHNLDYQQIDADIIFPDKPRHREALKVALSIQEV